MANVRRMWFVVPSHYYDNHTFDDDFPYCDGSTASGLQGQYAVNGDLDQPMVIESGFSSPTHLYLDGIGPFDGMYVEGSNWFETGYYNNRVEYNAGYVNTGVVSEVIGNGIASSNFWVPLGDNANLLVIYTEIDSDNVRIRFNAPLGVSADLSVPNIWIGKTYQMDAMFSLGSSTSNNYIQRPFEKSLSGLPLTQQISAESYGSNLRTFTLTFEWVDETQCGEIKEIYERTQGFRPFKMVLKKDGALYTNPEAYSVAFESSPTITEVEAGYYTITMTLREHN